jgi:hypothetical protein
MTSGDLVLRRLVHRGRLGASRVFLALRWMTLEKVLRVSVVRRWLYLTAKALRVGPARHCLILSLQWVVVTFSGDVKPPRLRYLLENYPLGYLQFFLIVLDILCRSFLWT